MVTFVEKEQNNRELTQIRHPSITEVASFAVTVGCSAAVVATLLFAANVAAGSLVARFDGRGRG